MNIRVVEIAFKKDTPAFTLAELIEKMKRYEQVAIARPLDASFKCALRVVMPSTMNARDEVGKICEKLYGDATGIEVAWNDSNERH